MNSLKALGKSIFVEVDTLVSSQQFRKLEKDTAYGINLSIEAVDQLGLPDEKMIEKYYGRINDLAAAKRFGTTDLDYYSHWAWRACGIANIATILRSLNFQDESLYDLVEEAREDKGYVEVDRNGNTDVGWDHSALARLLIRRGVLAKIQKNLSVYRVLNEVAKNNLFIASIRSRLSDGTHMILVSGFVIKESEILINTFDPFNLDGMGGEKQISLNDFQNIFLNKGILVDLSEQ